MTRYIIFGKLNMVYCICRGVGASKTKLALASKAKKSEGLFKFHVDKTGATGIPPRVYQVQYNKKICLFCFHQLK